MHCKILQSPIEFTEACQSAGACSGPRKVLLKPRAYNKGPKQQMAGGNNVAFIWLNHQHCYIFLNYMMLWCFTALTGDK